MATNWQRPPTSYSCYPATEQQHQQHYSTHSNSHPQALPLSLAPPELLAAHALLLLLLIGSPQQLGIAGR
jgi:hypothetical protein